MSNEMFPAFSNPPIREVVCGIKFRKLPGLDALLLGRYWSTIADDFPGRSIQEPLREPGTVEFGIGPQRIRSWFIAEDDTRLVQLQDDRFYFNWRLRDGQYPRFGAGGVGDGVLEQTLRRFFHFSSFVEEHLDTAVQLQGIELAKVNLILRSVFWDSLEELKELIPCLAGLQPFLDSDSPRFSLNWASPSEGKEDDCLCVIKMVPRTTDPVTKSTNAAVHLEFRTRDNMESVEDLEEAFIKANGRLNRLFLDVIPLAASHFNEEEEYVSGED